MKGGKLALPRHVSWRKIALALINLFLSVCRRSDWLQRNRFVIYVRLSVGFLTWGDSLTGGPS
ncbi:hypothetical protein SBA1_1780003 [Candidatus Sulfotelmatobacter kueseliae]|uniref:Uncharacterized protein n=1 Tax=Candidatus Sulfotelmatobacter kueseliae TaxID=2042962 RepID=A0A2U3KCW2_9BACT|nr:hypothetical protein SBA1_1780003 [Candidatus Sulfotelmatobacter kueseliae]